jgi:hypothetical protein
MQAGVAPRAASPGAQAWPFKLAQRQEVLAWGAAPVLMRVLVHVAARPAAAPSPELALRAAAAPLRAAAAPLRAAALAAAQLAAAG